MSKRLAPTPQEWIDRSNTVRFHFEGREVSAFHGDTLSSALLANGVRTLARSFKYHRPRGVLSAANHDANVLLETATATHIRADVEAPQPGEHYRACNTLGGLRFDATQALGLLSRFLPVGFYYKAFYRPRALFPYWERLIRELAGLGRVNTGARHARLPRRHEYCDVLIVGAGAAGLAAANELTGSGLSVLVADENARPGGALDYLHAGDADAERLRGEMLDAIQQSGQVRLLTRHVAAGFYDDLSVPLVGPGGVINVHARAVVVATGVYEQPAVFPHNDCPGVMLASAAARLVHRYRVAPATTATVIAGHAGAYDCAFDLHDNGVAIAAIVDLDDPGTREGRAERALESGIPVIPRATVTRAIRRRGVLAGVEVSTGGGAHQTITCDGLLMGVGWAPAASLLYQAGGALDYDAQVGQIVPTALPPPVFAAGRVNGVYALTDRVADGRAAAAEVCALLGRNRTTAERPPRAGTSQSHPYPIHAGTAGKRKAFVDFDEDLTVNDLEVAAREGFGDIELMKRYTTIGMGPSQGKVSNMNGVRIAAKLTGREIGAVGVTTTRPFTYPVPMRALAGRRMRRYWSTPMHAFHVDAGADMKEAGTWLRPMSYAADSPRSAIEAEYAAVRGAVGLIDVSTLGKVELVGPDAEALLEYVYTCSFNKLALGMTRYVFSVDGSGTLVDDGVVGRLGDGHFYLTATSSHAQAAVRQLHLVVAQLGLDVAVVDRTFQVAAMNVAGPQSAKVMAGLTDSEVDPAQFPYLAIRDAEIAGIHTRIMRVGFVGELGYEIHAPANQAHALWQAILNAGRDFDIQPFGVEAQRLLRLEKGHLLFGQDTDGTTNPFEARLGWGVRLAKPRFVGKHSLELLKPRMKRRLAGFECKAPAADTIRECHLVINNGDIAGRVTSVAHSPHRNAVIGLAMVDLPLDEVGTSISVRVSSGELVSASIVDTPFYDPDNLRQQPDAVE